jgi:nucleotide-binding universal stress UspA family protein
VRSLVYVDASPRGPWALAAARALGPALLGEVVLLASEEDVARDPGLLLRARAALGPMGDAAAEKRAPGAAEVSIVQEALSGGYGLLVVPPAGRGAIARMLKGSRVATVVRSVHAAVLVARRTPERLRRVLGAVSGGDTSGAVIDAARAVASVSGDHPDFVHVDDQVRLPGAANDAASPEPGVRALLSGHGREPLWREGLVVEEVLAEFEQGAYDLLVVGARPDPVEWGREDVTERLLLGCPGSVLVVPPGRVPALG